MLFLKNEIIFTLIIRFSLMQNNFHEQHQSQHFKIFDSSFRQKTQQRQHLTSNDYADKFLVALQKICSRFETIFETQNARIFSLQQGYGRQISQKIDRLISVNQSIGQGLSNMLQKIPFQTIVSGINSQLCRQQEVENIPETAFTQIRTCQKQDNVDKQLNYPVSDEHEMSVLRQLNAQLPLIKKVNSLLKQQCLQSPLLKRKLSKTELLSILKDFAFNGVDKINSESIKHFNKYIGDFYIRCAKHYYDLYITDKITYEDIKIRFSTDIFNELIQFQKQWIQFTLTLKVEELGKCHSNGKQFYKIFNQASIQSLRFLIYKYPPSRTNLIDMELSEKIKQIKSYSVVKYDLLKNAGMQFGLIQGQTDFSKEIKIWINKIINETRSQYHIFKQTMKSIFSGNDGSIDGSSRDIELEYSISSKIPENSQLYSEQQINSPGLLIKNPEILRVLIKWYEELIVNFTNPQQKIISNRFGFKSIHNKSIPIRIPQSKLQLLASHLRKIYTEQIIPKQSEEHLNIGIFIQGLISISLGGIEGLDFANQREIAVAKMSQCLYETFKSSLLTFLNLCLEKLVKVRSKYDNESFQSNIQLITFGIMDILRCKCTGSKQQIYRIYHQIIKNTDYFEIIRVKNKLNEPTKDILINLKIKKSFLICEIQLALGTSKQHTAGDFCHYLYELQRSKFGVLFECASQIYNFDPKIVYLKKNPNIDFKRNPVVQQALMDRIQVSDGLQCNSCHPSKKMIRVQNTRPFICLCCMSFIPGYFNKLAIHKCTICNFTICHQCSVILAQKNDQMMRMTFKLQLPSGVLIPEDMYYGQLKNVGLFNKQSIDDELLSVIDQYHNYAMLMVIDNNNYNFGVFKKYKSTVAETFCTIPQIPQMNVNMHASKAISVIVSLKHFQIKKVSELNQHRKVHISFAWCKLENILQQHGIQEVICIISDDNKLAFIIDVIQSQYEIEQFKLKRSAQKIVIKSNKSNGNCLEITSKGLDNFDFLTKVQNKCEISTLNLWQNKIQDISILSLFPNIQQLYLEQNKIKNIDAILHMSKLQLLTVGNNNISGPLPQLSLPQLQYLAITHNPIRDISSLTTSNIKSIILLKLSNTLINKLPKMDFPKLELIKADHCKINDISEFPKSNLPVLNKLNLQNNQITGEMQKFDFPMLSVLRLCYNKITSLNNFSKSDLPSLEILKISNNNLSSKIVPMNFKEVIEIDFSHNKLTSVSQDLFFSQHFPKLQRLLLRDNKFSGFAPRINIKNLKKLDMGQNELQAVAFDYNLHLNLQQLYFDHNRINQPVSTRKHPNLRKVDASYNLISDISKLQSWRVPELRQAKFNNNRISGPIPKLYLSSLQYLDLSNNDITEQRIVQSLHLIPHVININLSNNPEILEETIRKKYTEDQICCLSFV